MWEAQYLLPARALLLHCLPAAVTAAHWGRFSSLLSLVPLPGKVSAAFLTTGAVSFFFWTLAALGGW